MLVIYNVHGAEGGDLTRVGLYFNTSVTRAVHPTLVRDINLHNLRIFTVS